MTALIARSPAEALQTIDQAISQGVDPGQLAEQLLVNPNTVARAYLGEAYLEQGKLDKAKGQLSEIEKRCGTTCVEFTELSGQIKSFVTTGKFDPQGKADKKVPQKS